MGTPKQPGQDADAHRRLAIRHLEAVALLRAGIVPFREVEDYERWRRKVRAFLSPGQNEKAGE